MFATFLSLDKLILYDLLSKAEMILYVTDFKWFVTHETKIMLVVISIYLSVDFVKMLCLPLHINVCHYFSLLISFNALIFVQFLVLMYILL